MDGRKRANGSHRTIALPEGESGISLSRSTARGAVRYGGAVAAVAAALGVRWLLPDYVTTIAAFITFYPCVALVAILAGGRPAVLATALCAATSVGYLPAGGVAEALAIGLFGLSCLIVSGTAEALHRERRSRLATLEREVRTRTAELERANANLRGEVETRLQAEVSLRESEELFRTTFEQAAVGMAHVAPDGRFLRVNGRFAEITGYSREDLLAATFQAITHPDDLASDVDLVRQLSAGEIAHYAIEKRYVRKDGSMVWVNLTVSLRRTSDGEPLHFIKVVEDISRRKGVEEEVRVADRQLRDLLDNLFAFVALLEPDGTVRWVNRPPLEVGGLTAKQVIGRAFWDCAWWTHRSDVQARVRAAVEGAAAGRTARFDETIRTAGEGRMVIDFQVAFLRGGDGRVRYVLPSAVDVTERTQAEEALRASEERLRMAQEAGGVGTFDWDLVSNTARCSKEYFRVMGMAPRESDRVTFTEWQSWLHPEDRERILGTLRESLAREQESAADYRVVRADGQTRWISYRGRITRDGAGAPVRMLGAIQDVTDRNQAEEELRRVTAELHARVEELTTLLDILPGGVLLADPQCRRITGNRALNEMLGLPQGANASLTAEQSDMPAGVRVYRNGRELSADEFPMQVTGLSGRRIKDFDHDLVFPDGRVVTLLANTAPLLDESGAVRGVVGAYMDITERKRAEEKVRDREARIQAILNSAADAIITIDRQGIIETVNPAAERLFGYRPEEMVGRNVSLLMPPPYRAEHDGYLARYLATGVPHVIGAGREVVARRKDGTDFPVDLAVSAIDHLGRFTGIVRDATRRKELEREVVEIASQEQRRIGQDLHDSVGQELTALNLQAGDLADAVRTDPDAAPLAARMTEGLRRCQKDLRAVLRGLLPVPVDVEGLMAALADLADRTRRERGVECTFDCPAPVAVTDNLTATHLYLIAQEAVHNAVKHARPSAVRISLQAGPGLRLRVEDDGVGMPASPPDGRGLGLRVMQNRAAIIGARLSVGPSLPTGTAITCELTRGDHG